MATILSFPGGGINNFPLVQLIPLAVRVSAGAQAIFGKNFSNPPQLVRSVGKFFASDRAFNAFHTFFDLPSEEDRLNIASSLIDKFHRTYVAPPHFEKENNLPLELRLAFHPFQATEDFYFSSLTKREQRNYFNALGNTLLVTQHRVVSEKTSPHKDQEVLDLLYSAPPYFFGQTEPPLLMQQTLAALPMRTLSLLYRLLPLSSFLSISLDIKYVRFAQRFHEGSLDVYQNINNLDTSSTDIDRFFFHELGVMELLASDPDDSSQAQQAEEALLISELTQKSGNLFLGFERDVAQGSLYIAGAEVAYAEENHPALVSYLSRALQSPVSRIRNEAKTLREQYGVEIPG